MWDIVGKACGQPVYNLLGGPCRDRIRVYANGWSERPASPDEFARAAADVVARGFRRSSSIRSPTRGARTSAARRRTWRSSGCARCAKRSARRSRSWWRSIDAWRPTRRSAWPHRLEPFEPFWYEEPIDAEDIDGLAEVRRADQPAGGHRRSAVQQEPVCRGLRPAGGGHPQSGRVQLRRHPGAEGDRRHGRAVARDRGAAQLQQHHNGPGQHAAGLGVHPELSHHRVLRQFRGRGREIAPTRSKSRTATSRCPPPPAWASSSTKPPWRATRSRPPRAAHPPVQRRITSGAQSPATANQALTGTKSGQLRSRSFIIVGSTGQSVPKNGSFQRTPPAHSGW